MHIRELFIDLIHNLLQLGVAIATIVLQRWLLDLSSPEKDMRWVRKQHAYWLWKNAKFYRGKDLLYQIRAKKILRY